VAPIAKCRADVSLLTVVLVMKFAGYLPLYRIERIFRSAGISIQRQTQSNWVMQLYQHMLGEALSGDRLFTDSTSLRFIGRGPGCEKAVIWVYALPLEAAKTRHIWFTTFPLSGAINTASDS
jgi:hypothetical protein